MSSNSDHSKNGTDIVELLPDVYRSDINRALADAAFNKFLTKDDTKHVAGYVGQGNPTAVVNRQLQEVNSNGVIDPHRQAFQLAPVMYSTVGTNEHVLTQRGMMQQLSLIGVDTTNLDHWASTERFNWIPPINLDMFVNYADYFWKPAGAQTPAQYFTIENRCHKVTSKLRAYQTIIARRGETLTIQAIDYAANAFVIDGKHDDIFVDGFTFVTNGSTNINLQDKTWTVTSSSYDGSAETTSIVVSPDISIRQYISDVNNPPAEPTADYVGQWLYKYNNSTITPLSQLYMWNGSLWVIAPQHYPAVISLKDQEAIYQAEVNCACESDIGGWDSTQWDDSQQSTAMWNEDMLSHISWATEPEWIEHNTQTSAGDLWYDLSTDELKQRNTANTAWVVIRTSFSDVLVETTGHTRWDSSVGCVPQEHNQWTQQNMWVHKSELASFVGTKRAQVPILEYSSETELNEWTETVYSWKYRAENNNSFASTEAQPNRLELEPIKSYVADNKDGIWYLYLGTDRMSANRDIDYTSVFTPGYKFRIVDRHGSSAVYTAVGAVFRECGDTDPAHTPTGRFCTIVELEEIDFPSSELAGVEFETTAIEPNAPYTRIEPIRTSMNHAWNGYHVHWMLDVNSTTQRAVEPQMANPYIKQSQIASAEIISLTEGMVYATDTYQEFIPVISGITQVNLDYRFHFKPTYSSYYAVTGESGIRVYLNNVRQYGTYKELSYSLPGQPDYTVVDAAGLNDNVAATNFNYVYAIRFDKPLTVNDTVRVEVGPVSFYDMGMYGVPVRTVEDNAAFVAAVKSGLQPAYKSLTKYHRNEQNKTAINQYPQFNVYDVVTGKVVSTSPLFQFAESSDYAVDPSTQRRIVTTDDGREYTFEQHLVDRENGMLYAYRSITDNVPMYWYSPLTQQLKKWDGKAWASYIISQADTGMVAFTPVVSIEEPTTLRTQHMSIWANPLTLEMKQRDAINGVWNLLEAHISDADPTLETIWKSSKTNPIYTPAYVDSSRTPVAVGSAEGDWEVLSQWRNNPEHENHKSILYSQLITHLTDIVTSQPRIPGLTNRGIFTLNQKDYDYGLGGTIKEHNDAFDTLISAVNVTEMTPLSVFEFAQEQYSANMVTVRDTFNRVLVDALIGLSGYNVAGIKSRISERVITDFQNNDYVAQVYGDTTAYNASTGIGMPNWIATLPIVGMTRKVRPYMINDGVSAMLMHHDGHRSTVSYAAAEQDRLCRILVQTFNAAAPGSAVISATAPTSSILPVYWYQINAGQPLLYKLVSQASRTWELVDFAELLGQVYLDIENRLYSAVPFYPTLVFDYSTLTTSDDDRATFDARMYDRFMEYVVKRQVRTPLVNTTYTLRDPYTWNYANSVLATPPTTKPAAPRACWQALYEYWYGTAFPHLEPWVLQGYTEKPLWWDNEYADTTFTRRWKYNHATKTGMWENIRVGNVPAGYLYPDGVTYSTGDTAADGQSLPTYEYFSVNISDAQIQGGYNPDDMLPPYYDNTLLAPVHPTVRSMFNVFSTQVVAPGADYRFGEQGPTEWEWLTSSEHVYDTPIVAFLMQPSKFLHQAWGLDYIEIGGLQIDVITKKVYNHREAMFHGDLYDTNKVYVANGMNQWYVNYNRFKGFDTNVDFRSMWTGWSPRQSYQTAGIIDTSTLQIFNKNFDVTERDFKVVLANSGVLQELWADAFNVSLITIPPQLNQYNNQSQWKFTVDTLAPVSRTVEYYGPQLYPFIADPATDTLTAFAFDIDDVTAAVRQFEVRGNQTPFFFAGVSFVVSGSSTNDGTYTVEKAAYDTINATTRISVIESVPTSIRDGRIDIPDFAHNWLDGDMVMLNATAPLPFPFEDAIPYYVIRVDARKIKLAQNPDRATAGLAIDITSVGQGDLSVGKVASTFYAFDGAESPDLWMHYELNKNDIRELRSPEIIQGMQNLISFVDGYVALQTDRGLAYNYSKDFVEYDSLTGRPAGWQLEIERLIDWAYALRRSRLQIVDRFDVTVSSVLANTLRFSDNPPAWTSGTKVAVASIGTLPTPLFQNTMYYVVRTDDPYIIKLSTSSNAADTSKIVNLEDVGSGIITVSLYQRDQSYPRMELNPQRNNLWITSPQGMLSNIITGPYSDIRATQTIYDQYGRFITPEQLMLYRGDLTSRVTIRPEIPNDVELYPQGLMDTNNFLHMGGGHFFIEGYEHVIMFNNYTVGKDLVYDPFLGLSILRFDLDYFKKAEYTMRPTLGGYFLKGNDFVRNIEGSIEDMRRYYDAFSLIEGTDTARHARHLLGYHPEDGNMAYLDLLNTNAKSQFLFYRGMIQAKGSVNAIKAYINSKKFVDAKVDEFWAYKHATFGDSRKKVHPRIKLYADDGRKIDIRLKFQDSTDVDYTAIEDIKKGFETVSFGDGKRWVDFPQQRDDIGSPIFLDAAITSMSRVYITHSIGGNATAPINGQKTIDMWIHITHNATGTPTAVQAFKWSDADGWTVTQTPAMRVTGHDVYMHLPHISDGVRVLRRRLADVGTLSNYTTEMVNEVNAANGYSRVNSEIVKFASTSFGTSSVVVAQLPDNTGGFITRTVVVLDDQEDSSTTNVFIPGDRVLLTVDGTSTYYTVDGSTIINISSGIDPDFRTVVYVREPINTTTSAGSLTHVGADGVFIIFTVNVGKERINPAALLDVRSHVKLDNIPLWHPAAGIHTPLAAHNVDLMTPTDPARYTTTVMPSDVSANPWLTAEKNVTWLDTSRLAYLPYYDDIIHPDVDERISRWGHRPAWSDVKVYQWVETLTHPDDWDSVAAKQSGDASITDAEKVTGTPRKTLFKRVRKADTAVVADDVLGILALTTFNNKYVSGTQVYVSPTNAADTLPKTLETGVLYTVAMYDDVDHRFTLTDIDGTVIDLTDVPPLTLLQAFDDNWVRKDFVHSRSFAAMQADFVSNTTVYWEPTLTVSGDAWEAGDIVDVYVNGTMIAQNVAIVTNGNGFDVSTAGSNYRMVEKDIIDIVRPIPTLTDAQRAFDPDVEDDGVTLEHWTEVVEFSTTTRSVGGITYTYYYFWVENVSVPRRLNDMDCLSALETAKQLATIPTPYMIVLDPHDELWARGYDVPPYDRTGYDDDMYLAYNDRNQFMPSIFYRKAILSQITSRIDEDDRYVVEFTRDCTLRDDVAANNGQMNVKNQHEKWMMFRREQVGAVPEHLWVKMVEALMGCQYDDFTIRVPSFEREHYDELNGTDTQYGLGNGQIFAKPEFARATLLGYLQNPAHDFKPVDINHFFEQFPATTEAFWQDPQAVKDMCDFIYRTFNTEHTNGIWFDILSDALVTKAKYTGLMKTSWLALHGIRILDVAGLFDD